MERKLAAILAADVVGYSRLMERDEAGTQPGPKPDPSGLSNMPRSKVNIGLSGFKSRTQGRSEVHDGICANTSGTNSQFPSAPRSEGRYRDSGKAIDIV